MIQNNHDGDAWKKNICGGKPCPDPRSIRHHWWSSGQDLCFRCRGSPAARVWTSVGAEVGASPKVLQSGDPDVIYTHHTNCKDYCTSHCTAPTPHCSVFLSAHLHTPLKNLTHSRATYSATSMLGAEIFGGKPCPDPRSIRHHWWSSGQDLCFRCRGSPAAFLHIAPLKDNWLKKEFLKSGKSDNHSN